MIRDTDDMALMPEDGVPFLTSEIVLLFKAKLMRSWDQADFESVAPIVGIERRSWLRAAPEQSNPSRRWVAELA